MGKTARDRRFDFIPADYKPRVVGIEHTYENWYKVLSFLDENVKRGDTIAFEGSPDYIRRVKEHGTQGQSTIVWFAYNFYRELEKRGINYVYLDSDRIGKMTERRGHSRDPKDRMITTGLREWRWLRRLARKRPPSSSLVSPTGNRWPKHLESSPNT